MDIFKRIPGKDPITVETAQDRAIAILRMLELCMKAPGNYFVYDANECRVLASASLHLPAKAGHQS